MPRKPTENLTRNLFNPDEELKPGEAMDPSGDVYDERGLLKREAPSPEWIAARDVVRKSRPDINEEDPIFNALAKIHLAEIKAKAKKKKSK